MELWKNQTCKNCKFHQEASRPNGPVDLSAPKILICRHSPPVIVYAIGQSRGGINPSPVPMPLGSMYPMVDETHPACSYYAEEQQIKIENPHTRISFGDIS